MQEVTVLVQFLGMPEFAPSLPKYATEGSSGFDLVAAEPAIVASGDWCLIGTKIAVSVPYGYELQIRSRSGMARKGLIVLNQPGTLDSDYRGEVGVLLLNVGQKPQKIAPGERIAQGIICPVARAKFQRSATLDETARGAGGYGSTGERSQ